MASPITPDVASPVSGSQASSRFKLTILKAQGLPAKRGWKHGNFYVSVTVDGNVWKTQSVRGKRSVAEWNTTFEFETPRSSSMKVEMYNSHLIRQNKCIGSFQDNISSMLALNSSAVSRNLDTIEAPSNQAALSINFVLETQSTEPRSEALHVNPTVEFPDAQVNAVPNWEELSPVVDSVTDSLQPLDEVEGAVQKAKEDVGQMKSLGGGSSLAENADKIESVGEGAVQAAGAWAPLFKNLKLFSELMDGISEIHPYAKMAWSVISVIPKGIQAQLALDTDIKGLLSMMGDVLSFVHDADVLKKVKSQKSVIALMAQQTTECAYFLQKYAKDKDFFKRTLKNIASGATQIIQEYKAKFQELSDAFKLNAALQTQITVVRVAEVVERLEIKMILNDIPYAQGARFDTEKMCLSGTRTEILDHITHWINNERSNESRIFLLTGGAGTGKSAIAHTIARRFYDLHRLGSSFCCNRSDVARRSPAKLFSTIARDLADHYPKFGNSLAKLDTATLKTQGVTDQFDNLVIKPTVGLSIMGPMVIVIDALDEIGDPTARSRVTELLAKRAMDFPTDFRILLTSRPEPDILGFFHNAQGVTQYSMESVENTHRDIVMYIHVQLKDSYGQPFKELDNTKCNKLAVKSENIFQWVYVACKTIKQERIGGPSPLDRYNLLMASTTDNKGLGLLDELYIQVLSDLFGKEEDSEALGQFQAVLGWVLAPFEPLPITSLQRLQMQGKEDKITSILRYMGSLLSGISEDSQIPVRPLHTSFRDFLTDPHRSAQFYINTSDYHQGLCLSSLCTMNKSLHFNICSLPTSYCRNVDVPGLESSVKDKIHPALSYSCRFWGDHLKVIPYNDEVHEAAKSFLYKSLLFWFEALSLLKNVNVARQALLSLVAWTKDYDTDLTEFGKDAAKLISYFGGPIAESAPHTYLSVIPWAPTTSIVTSHYRSQFRHILTVVKGRQSNWPAVQLLLEGHKGTVWSVAFSSNGKQIVSGSNDSTICVWDVETGGQMLEPFVGHSSSVISVAFSSDGKQIVSGSGDNTIRVWDVETGEQVLSLFLGHNCPVMSVIFSLNDKRVISGSGDNTIRVWDIETGGQVLESFLGCNVVMSVAFSPDGKQVVSGLGDSTIRVSDVETGSQILTLFMGQNNWVESVAFSPDAKQIVSGSTESSICVWDVKTGSQILALFVGHDQPIRSVAFSPNGQQIVSGSEDNIVRIWDVEAGGQVLESFVGHYDSVLSVAFSPDGKQIVSSSADNNICVWDVKTGGQVLESFVGHNNWVQSVAFSPDGTQIVSGSADYTIRVWDIETGDQVLAPFLGHNFKVKSVAFSPDGKQIVSGSSDRTIRIWDVETGSQMLTLFMEHWVESVAFSPDGKQIASSLDGNKIHIWDAKTGNQVLELFVRQHHNSFMSVAFSPDGKQIVSGSGDNTVYVWDLETGGQVLKSFVGHNNWVQSVAFSPNSKQIVSGSRDNTICVWDVETGGQILKPFVGHSNSVQSVAFSPNGKQIVSGSDDNTICVWDVETGEQVLAPFLGHNDSVMSVAFSPDGKQIVSGSKDNTIRIWDVEAQDVSSWSFIGDRGTMESSHLDQSEHATYMGDHCQDRTLIDNINHSIMTNGWLLGPNSELLVWIAPVHQTAFMRPNMVTVIGRNLTRVDLHNFAHGDSWQDCYTPRLENNCDS